MFGGAGQSPCVRAWSGLNGHTVCDDSAAESGVSGLFVPLTIRTTDYLYYV